MKRWNRDWHFGNPAELQEGEMWLSGGWRGLAVTAIWVLLIGCGADQPALGDEEPTTLPPMAEEAAEMPEPDAETLRREADETDRIVIELRNHVARMRGATTPAMRNGMNQHRAQVAAVLQLVQRAVSVEDSGSQTMQEDQLRLMREEMQTALEEMEALRTVSESDFRRRMAGHLDRLERVAAMLESHAADLRRQ